MSSWKLARALLVLPGTATFFLLSGCSSYDVSHYPVNDTIVLREPTAATSSAPVSQPTSAEGGAGEPNAPLQITVRRAILLTLQNNRELVVERINPSIRRTFEEQEEGVFDPVLSATGQHQRTKSKQGGDFLLSDVTSAGASLEKLFPTGTTAFLDASTSLAESSLAHLYDDRSASSRLAMTVTQALLKGFGPAVNLASLHQARLDTLVSQYELRAFAESLVAQAEQTYWDYALAQRQIDIFTQSLSLAEQQLNETQERIKIGKLAETELAAFQAEVALRKGALINANSTLAKTRLNLLRLLNPPGDDLWRREVLLHDQPAVPDVKLEDVESHVAVAMRCRPDLNEARLAVQRGDLEIVKTRNGLLPKLDLFITLGRTGYADTFRGSIPDSADRTYDALAGVSLEYPLGNHDARARHQRAVLTRDQSREAVGNLEQTVQVDVRSAHLEVRRAREQVTATTATRKFQEEKLRAETEKFRVGKSTSLLVAQAQRDLVASQIEEISAVTTFLKAMVDLYRLEGSLLERRGVIAPGREPVKGQK